jgi:hypothetical protein
VTPDALATMMVAPSVINGIVVLVVVGGSVVVVVVVVVVVLVLVVVGGMVVVVVVVEVVVAGAVVVVATAPGPKVQPASRDTIAIVTTRLDDDWKRGVICRRASRSSVHPVDSARCRQVGARTSFERVATGVAWSGRITPRLTGGSSWRWIW